MIISTKTKPFTFILLLIFCAIFLTDSAYAGSDRIRLECEAEGPRDISMDARYEQRRTREKFDVSFEALPGGQFFVGQTLIVRVARRNVGQMRLEAALNGDIVGDLNFDTMANGLDDDPPFPDNFPNVRNRTTVRLLANNSKVLGCRLN